MVAAREARMLALQNNIQRYCRLLATDLTDSERGFIHRKLAEDLPVVPLWHEDNVALVNRDVEGYVVLPNARFTGLAKVTKR